MTDSVWVQVVSAATATGGAMGAILRWFLTSKLKQEQAAHIQRMESDKATQQLLGIIADLLIATMNKAIGNDELAKAMTDLAAKRCEAAKTHSAQ